MLTVLRCLHEDKGMLVLKSCCCCCLLSRVVFSQPSVVWLLTVVWLTDYRRDGLLTTNAVWSTMYRLTCATG